MKGSRRWLVAGAALVGLAGGSAVAWGVMADSDDPDPASARTVLATDEAEPAAAGTSRRIWRELTGDVRVVGIPWTSDERPRLVVGAESSPTSVELVDRRTGDRTPLPTLWQGHDRSPQPIRVTPRLVWVSWVHHVDGVERPAALRYDIATGEHRMILAPAVRRHPRATGTSPLQYGEGSRFYFRTFRIGHDGADKHTRLWSFASEGPRDVREEGTAQQWTVSGALFASLDHGNGGPTSVRVHDLSAGTDRTTTLDGCDDPYLEASSSFAVVACEDDAEVVVLDRSGTEVAQLEIPDGVNASGYGPPSLHVGKRWISIGRLAYEPETGQLLRLRAHPAAS